MWPLTTAAVIGWLFSGKIGKLFLVEHCHLSAECLNGLHKSLYYLKTWMHITYPIATGIITVSSGVKKDVCKLSGMQNEKVKLIYNPAAIGVTSIRSSQFEIERLWGRKYSYHILSIGSLKKEKNHENLIKAFAKLPNILNANLTIIGEGSLRSSLEQLIDNLGVQDKVNMPGFYEDVYQWYKSADLFVLSSDVEGLPTVLIEALECGLPIVSTATYGGGAEEILENGNYGIIVPPRNENALAAAIEESIRKKHDRNKLIKRGKEFLVEKISKEYLEYFNIN
jgi:glycosyltransferase involved in cell wall biosynthesis